MIIDPNMCGQPFVFGRLPYGACAGVVHPEEVVVRLRRWELAVPAVVLLCALPLNGCTTTSTTTDGIATETSEAASSSFGSSMSSLAAPSLSSPSSSSAAPPTTNSPDPWPADLSPDQVAQAQAALTAYKGYIKLVEQAYTDPGGDWSAEVVNWASDPVSSSLLRNLAATAELGQYRDGSFAIEPTVTQVDQGVVTMTVCVDATDVGFYDKSGTSIKAPDAPGTYLRHPSTVTVAKFQGDQWLVYEIVDDYNTTC